MNKILGLFLVLMLVLVAADVNEQLVDIKIHEPTSGKVYQNFIEIKYTMMPIIYKRVDLGQAASLKISIYELTKESHNQFKKGKFLEVIESSANVTQDNTLFVAHFLPDGWNAKAHGLVSGWYSIEFVEEFHCRGGVEEFIEDVYIDLHIH